MFAKLSIAILLVSVPLCAQFDGMLGNKPILDAHNCYPYEGKWPDRIDRAISTGFPVSIEQDIAWYQGKVVVSHTPITNGSEPLLTDYFFARVRPIIEKALKENQARNLARHHPTLRFQRHASAFAPRRLGCSRPIRRLDHHRS